jgi:hypothetical protein
MALRGPPQWRLNTKWAKATESPLVPPGSASFSPFFLIRFIARNWYFSDRSAPAPFSLDSALIRKRAGARASQ